MYGRSLCLQVSVILFYVEIRSREFKYTFEYVTHPRCKQVKQPLNGVKRIEFQSKADQDSRNRFSRNNPKGNGCRKVSITLATKQSLELVRIDGNWKLVKDVVPLPTADEMRKVFEFKSSSRELERNVREKSFSVLIGVWINK